MEVGLTQNTYGALMYLLDRCLWCVLMCIFCVSLCFSVQPDAICCVNSLFPRIKSFISTLHYSHIVSQYINCIETNYILKRSIITEFTVFLLFGFFYSRYIECRKAYLCCHSSDCYQNIKKFSKKKIWGMGYVIEIFSAYGLSMGNNENNYAGQIMSLFTLKAQTYEESTKCNSNIWQVSIIRVFNWLVKKLKHFTRIG